MSGAVIVLSPPRATVTAPSKFGSRGCRVNDFCGKVLTGVPRDIERIEKWYFKKKRGGAVADIVNDGRAHRVDPVGT